MNRAAAIQKPIQKFSLIYRDHQWQYRAFWLMIAVGFYLTKTYFRPIESLQKISSTNQNMERIERKEWNIGMF